MPFDRRPDEAGYTVFDLSSGEPAVINGRAMVGLKPEDAADLADLLNRQERKQESAGIH